MTELADKNYQIAMFMEVSGELEAAVSRFMRDIYNFALLKKKKYAHFQILALSPSLSLERQKVWTMKRPACH